MSKSFCPSMECLVYNKVRQRVLSDAEIQRLVKKILARFKSLDKTLSVQFIGERKIRELNKKYRGIDRVTDVLSFGLGGDDLGDIFLCYPQIKKQAKQYQVTEKEEMKRMLIHGILHLLGFEHKRKNEAQKMFKLQDGLLREFL